MPGKERKAGNLREYKTIAFEALLEHKFKFTPKTATNFLLQRLKEEAEGARQRKKRSFAKINLGKNFWTDGVILGPRNLTFKNRGRIAMETVFDTAGSKFHFCNWIKELPAAQGQKRVELQEIYDEGHRVFFEEANLNQQKDLLLSAFKKIVEA